METALLEILTPYDLNCITEDHVNTVSKVFPAINNVLPVLPEGNAEELIQKTLDTYYNFNSCDDRRARFNSFLLSSQDIVTSYQQFYDSLPHELQQKADYLPRYGQEEY